MILELVGEVTMLELARKRLGDDTALRAADLSGPLPFRDGAFDDVIACLVLHYLEDWTAPLAELRRVLTHGGRLVVAVNHPFVRKLADPEADYFATHTWSEEHTFGGRSAVLRLWHRSLHAMAGAFTAAGFRIAVVSEPPPAPGAREVFPEIAELPSGAFLCFLFFVLEAV
ncbi:class I SAM-dependent methyltransferase [Streptomyces aquilus]|uniref:class I SAM-dependent methyltransferase n=1 Tax=Streptomyces aquilus TaxID=2548456 RepID=UPI003698FCBB